MLNWFRKKKEEPEVEVVAGPIIPTKIERFYFEGGSVALYAPRVQYFMNGKVVVGSPVDENGMIAASTTQLDMSHVTSSVALGWDRGLACFVELLDQPKPSEF